MHARRQPPPVREYSGPRRLDDDRILDLGKEPPHTGCRVDKMRAGNRDAAFRSTLEQAPLVGHEVESLERRGGDRRIALERVALSRDRICRDIRNRHDKIDPLSTNEVEQEPLECFWMPIR